MSSVQSTPSGDAGPSGVSILSMSSLVKGKRVWMRFSRPMGISRIIIVFTTSRSFRRHRRFVATSGCTKTIKASRRDSQTARTKELCSDYASYAGCVRSLRNALIVSLGPGNDSHRSACPLADFLTHCNNNLSQHFAAMAVV